MENDTKRDRRVARDTRVVLWVIMKWFAVIFIVVPSVVAIVDSYLTAHTVTFHAR